MNKKAKLHAKFELTGFINYKQKGPKLLGRICYSHNTDCVCYDATQQANVTRGICVSCRNNKGVLTFRDAFTVLETAKPAAVICCCTCNINMKHFCYSS